MKIVLDGGMQIEGERVDFKPLEEPWAKYQLPDGTIIRLRIVVSDIIRSSKKNAADEPIYAVRSSNVLAVDLADTPEEIH
jgi:hypothetical protein